MPFFRTKEIKDYTNEKEDNESALRKIIFEGEGNSYSGEWKGVLKHGFGTQLWKEKRLMYTGFWKNGKRDGKGMLYFENKPDAFVYNGMWRKDKRNGYGIQFYPDGGKYNGEWRKDKRNGFGQMRYDDGSSYVGQWKRDWRSGRGVMVYADGSVYTGEWKQGRRCGEGTLVTSTKDEYKGPWQNDMKHGKGTYFNQSAGTQRIGVWVRDIPCCASLKAVLTDSPISPLMLPIPECTLQDPESVINAAMEYYLKIAMKDR